MESYLKLTAISRETIGASFTLGFYPRNNEHKVYFPVTKKNFISKDPEVAIAEAIKYILEEREEEDGQAGLKFTLMKSKFNFRNYR